MEDILEKLSSSHVSLDEADISLIHPRYCELKKRIPEICNQEKRRQDWLNNLKAKREKSINLNRGIKDERHEEYMEIDKKHKVNREYKGWLMLSEWLIEVPNDIYENWLCTICPEGKRSLVVAEMGKTMAYRRNGDFICSQFPSWLPGGSKYTYKGKTILDTIFDRTNSVFYVLDVVYWGIDTTDFEADMRFYWLYTKIIEIPQLKEKFNTNRYKFLPLEHFPYSMLQEKMMVYPAFPRNSPKVDGIIFYHKNSTYVHSRSPLVTWLNPFMLPDILKMEVAHQYLSERPPQYQKMEIEQQAAS